MVYGTATLFPGAVLVFKNQPSGRVFTPCLGGLGFDPWPVKPKIPISS